MEETDEPEIVVGDGGPALPVLDLSKTQCPGMSLRDYFAGLALAGEMATQGPGHGDADDVFKPPFDWLGVRCYEIADAMLKARLNTGGAEQ